MISREIYKHSKGFVHNQMFSFFLSATAIGMVHDYVDTVLRTMISICVPKQELGKILALIGFIHSVLSLFVPQIFTSIFNVRLLAQFLLQVYFYNFALAVGHGLKVKKYC